MNRRTRSKGRTNAEAYEFYKEYIRSGIDSKTLKTIANIPSPANPTFLGKLVGLWKSRYGRRQDTIDQWRLSDTNPPLADTIAKEILVARTRAHNALCSTLPDLPASQFAFAQMQLASPPVEVSTLVDVPSYGPSFISLWAAAKNQGLSDEECAQSILRWRCQEPPGWTRDDERKIKKLPVLDGKVKARLDQIVAWRQTGDLVMPWSADVDSHHWQARVNDFPDEPMYSLLIDETPVGDFHDWPEAWNRRAPKDKIKSVKPAVITESIHWIDPDTLLSRYQNGEHLDVWRELVALGPHVREPRYEEAAHAVVKEMMRRVRHNLVLLVKRLRSMNYQFLCGEFQHPPSTESHAEIACCEQEGLLMPLALRVFLEDIGSASLLGTHAKLSPPNRVVETNTLEISGVWDGTLEHWLEQRPEDREPVAFEVCPDAKGKIDILEDALPHSWYTVQLPNASVDALLTGEPGSRTFVDHLRWNFQWGGFPGWEQYEDRPEEELAFLREGLLPI